MFEIRIPIAARVRLKIIAAQPGDEEAIGRYWEGTVLKSSIRSLVVSMEDPTGEWDDGEGVQFDRLPDRELWAEANTMGMFGWEVTWL